MLDIKLQPIIGKVAKSSLNLENTLKNEQGQLESTDYQHIEYCMANTSQFIPISQHRHIGLVEAITNTSDLDWTYRKNGISFINKKTDDSLFFCRMDSGNWYADTPIRLPRYDGLVWISVVDQITMERLLGLFFAGSDWFSSTSWFDSPVPFEIVSSKGMYGMY